MLIETRRQRRARCKVEQHVRERTRVGRRDVARRHPCHGRNDQAASDAAGGSRCVARASVPSNEELGRLARFLDGDFPAALVLDLPVEYETLSFDPLAAVAARHDVVA